MENLLLTTSWLVWIFKIWIWPLIAFNKIDVNSIQWRLYFNALYKQHYTKIGRTIWKYARKIKSRRNSTFTEKRYIYKINNIYGEKDEKKNNIIDH